MRSLTSVQGLTGLLAGAQSDDVTQLVLALVVLVDAVAVPRAGQHRRAKARPAIVMSEISAPLALGDGLASRGRSRTTIGPLEGIDTTTKRGPSRSQL